MKDLKMVIDNLLILAFEFLSYSGKQIGGLSYYRIILLLQKMNS